MKPMMFLELLEFRSALRCGHSCAVEDCTCCSCSTNRVPDKQGTVGLINIVVPC